MHNVHFLVCNDVALAVQERKEVHRLGLLHHSMVRVPFGQGPSVDLDQDLSHFYSSMKPLLIGIPLASFAINLEDINRPSFVSQILYRILQSLELLWLTMALLNSVHLSLSSMYFLLTWGQVGEVDCWWWKRIGCVGQNRFGFVRQAPLVINRTCSVDCTTEITRIKGMNLTVRSYLIQHGLLKGGVTVRSNRVNQATVIYESMRIANPFATIAIPSYPSLVSARKVWLKVTLEEILGENLPVA